MSDQTVPAQLDLVIDRAAGVGLRAAVLRGGILGLTTGSGLLLSRALGPRGLGQVAFAYALLTLVIALSNFGFESAQVYRAGQGDPLSALWANALLAALVLGVLSAGLVALIYVVEPSLLGGLPAGWVALTVGVVPFTLHVLFWSNILQLHERLLAAMRAAFAASLVRTAVVLALFLASALTPFRGIAILWILPGITWVIVVIESARAGLVRLRPDARSLGRTLRTGATAHLGTISGFLVLRVDQFLVQRKLGFAALGIYAVAVTVGEPLWHLTEPLARAILPHQLQAAATDQRRMGFAVARVNVLLALIGAGAVWIAAPYALPLLFGRQFGAAAWPLRLLLPGVVALAIVRPLTSILMVEGRMLLMSGIATAGLVFNVVANLVLLPVFGVNAASIVSSITYGGLAVASVALVRHVDVPPRMLLPHLSDLALLRRQFRFRGRNESTPAD